jgi:chromosome segregation ATPase
MATRRTNRLDESKFLRNCFQYVEDGISTILKEKDEKIKELENALEAKNGKVKELETALKKSNQNFAQRNTIHKSEINTLKGECQHSEQQIRVLTAKIHLLEKADAETEKLRSQLESRKRKWEAMKEVMEGDGYDQINDIGDKKQRIELQSTARDLVVIELE